MALKPTRFRYAPAVGLALRYTRSGLDRPKPNQTGGVRLDLETNLRRYLDGTKAGGGRRPDTRYTSFDYCFNYFQSFRESGKVEAMAYPEHIQLSCLQLGFYLASWGMLRGSADLLQKSARHLVPVIETIAGTDPSFWEIDADTYTESNIERILEHSKILRGAIGSLSEILATKIMLGVFGNVPAFDKNFKDGFGVSTLGPKALRKIGTFYQQNSELLERYRVPTLDFVTAEPTMRLYTKAKVIDMAFFIEGMS